MLGGSCSPCCSNWTCYYTVDSVLPIQPANFSAGSVTCSDERFGTVKLQWDTPYDYGDCIPVMTYDVDISGDYIASTGTGTWQPARLASGDVAYGITRTQILGNDVELKCQYNVLFTEGMQIAFYRANGSLPVRKVHFRVRSVAQNGPYNGQTSAWSIYGPVLDPRYCSNDSGEVNRNVAGGWFEVPIFIQDSGYADPADGVCSTPNSLVDIYAITSASNAFPASAVKQAMFFNTTSAVTLGLPLDDLVTTNIEGTGLLAYDHNISTIWVLVQLQNATEVLSIRRMTMSS